MTDEERFEIVWGKDGIYADLTLKEWCKVYYLDGLAEGRKMERERCCNHIINHSTCNDGRRGDVEAFVPDSAGLLADIRKGGQE